MKPDGSLISDDIEKASLLNETFASKFTDPTVNNFPVAPDYPLDNFPRFLVTEQSVRSALNSISPNKACGSDNISAKIILECREELVVPLFKIASKSFQSGRFPSRWKSANIIPIFKKGDKKDPSNYRSVSLLSLFAKILERIAYDQLFRHVSPALSPEQHGFVPRRSCVSNLSVFLKSAWEAFSEGYQMDAIYTDFSAAFQSVNHKLLIYKLQNSYHLKDSALNWFISYLSDRRQRVILNGKTSEWKNVSSGVPEGSLNAPLLFALFINDLPAEIDSGCLLYADDAKIFRKIKQPSDGFLLQSDLSRLHQWSIRWGLKLNPSKCKTITLTLRRTPVQTAYCIENTYLDSVEEIRDLGVIIDSKLNFSTHVSGITRQANKALGLLIRSFQTGLRSSNFNTKTLLTTYYANVRSILEYGSVVWAGVAKSHAERVERVQHKFWM